MRKINTSEMGRPSVSEYAKMDKVQVTVVLDNIRSMNNVGSFFRTCDAFSLERLILCGITGTPPDREIHKTALGAENTVNWEKFETTAQALSKLIGEGYEVVAVEQTDCSVSLEDFVVDGDKKYALVFGNEVEGVGAEALESCGSAIEIPQSGTKHSLNVAVAGGIVLWHFYRGFLDGSNP